MRKTELDEMRAMLRAQAAAAATTAPARKGLLSGIKSLVSKSPPVRRPPLNLTPLTLTPAASQPIGSSRTEAANEPATLDASRDDGVPMLFIAPKRERFGLADEGSRPVAAPMLKLKASFPPEPLPEPRRKGPSLAATEAAGIGADEILELHDMLSERMPHLLEQIDLEAKLAPSPDLDQPNIAAVEAARASADQAAAASAWGEASAVLRVCTWDDSAEAHARRSRLALAHAEAASEHALLKGDLDAVRNARRDALLAA